MNKKLLILIAVILFVSGVGVYYFFTNKKVSVEKATIYNEVVEKTIPASGEIVADDEADLAFANTGQISKINYKEGDSVEKGKIIATLNSYSVSQEAKATKDARDIALRNKDLFLEDHKDDPDYFKSEEYKIRLRKYDEYISQAEAKYRSVLGNLTNLYIKTPFSGTIININKDVGEVAGAGEVVVKLANLDDLYMQVYLDQEDFGQVHVGQQATVKLDSYEDTTYDATVTKLSDYAKIDESGDKSFEANLKIEPQKGKPILLGMTGDVSIIVDKTSKPVMALDYDVIQYDKDDKPFIWVADGKILKKQYIDLGLEGDVLTEIKNDISNVAVIIPPEKPELKEGMKVVVTK